MTDHVEYLAQVVRMTIEQEMRKEAGYLLRRELLTHRYLALNVAQCW